MTVAPLPPSVSWTGDAIEIIDQRLLPGELVIRRLVDTDDVVDAITTLAVRGANCIGTVGALGVALAWQQGGDSEEAGRRIADSRPTAVNLRVSVDRALQVVRDGGDPTAVGVALIEEDRLVCQAIGENGRVLLSGADRILTHCNTGRLATTGWGTALGIVYAKAEAGDPVKVYATETRPLLQGSRLTVWELSRAGIDVELLTDGAAAFALSKGLIDAVVVGADRISANGDTANKVGTLSLAVAARHWDVPFYVAAPRSAFDPAIATGDAIPIEIRSADEVRRFGETQAATTDVDVWNPAFDVTPASLISGIVTEVGVLEAPYTRSIETALSR